MAHEDDASASSDTGRILPADAPLDLEKSAQELRHARREFTALIHEVALWRVVAYDRALTARMGRSYAAQGFLTARSMALRAVILSMNRMFDQDTAALNLQRTCNRLLKPDNAAWLRNHRITQASEIPEVGTLGDASEEESRAFMRRLVQQDMAEAGWCFDEEAAGLKHILRRFRAGGDACGALARLKEMRNKEVAHIELEPVWATVRPTLKDLDVAYEAIRDLLIRANRLCTRLDISAPAFEETAQLAAVCFVLGLRSETPEDRKSVRAALKRSVTEDD